MQSCVVVGDCWKQLWEVVRLSFAGLSCLVSQCIHGPYHFHLHDSAACHTCVPCTTLLRQVSPVTAGLDDRHPYVRRTAVMGVLKIWHMNPDVVDSQGMLQHVQQLLSQDSDAQVLGNCVTLLLQVQGVKRLSSNKLLVYTLINRIKVGTRMQWGSCDCCALESRVAPLIGSRHWWAEWVCLLV